jgi:hypothetical protein
VTIDGDALDVGFIDHLYTPLVTTGNYSAIANLHALQIATAPATLFQPAASSTAVPQQRLLTVEIVQFPALTRRYCPANIPQLD